MKECLNCKKEFQPKKDTAKYCSVSCRVMWNRNNGKKVVSEKTKFDIILKRMDEIESKLNFSPTSAASFDGSDDNKINHDDISNRPSQKPISYNSLLDEVPLLKSIDQCIKMDAVVRNSTLAGWQKTNLSRMIKERSQHSDLN